MRLPGYHHLSFVSIHIIPNPGSLGCTATLNHNISASGVPGALSVAFQSNLCDMLEHSAGQHRDSTVLKLHWPCIALFFYLMMRFASCFCGARAYPSLLIFTSVSRCSGRTHMFDIQNSELSSCEADPVSCFCTFTSAPILFTNRLLGLGNKLVGPWESVKCPEIWEAMKGLRFFGMLMAGPKMQKKNSDSSDLY